MTQEGLLTERFRTKADKRALSSKCWLVVCVVALVVGTFFQEYELILGGFLSLLMAGLSKDVAALYSSVGTLRAEVRQLQQ